MSKISRCILVIAAILCGSLPALPTEIDPCFAFTPDADYATNIIVMRKENRRVGLRVPVQYWEDYWDKRGGFEDYAQLFRVDMDDFTPVTRKQTSERLRSGRDNYMNFVAGDDNGPESWALNFATPRDRTTRLTDLPPGQLSPAGLTWLDTEFSSVSRFPEEDLFVAYNATDEVDSTIRCTSPKAPQTKKPMCSQYFRGGGLDVQMDYPRIFIHRWAELQHNTARFLQCSAVELPASEKD
ncbi:hypothetical protein FP2506_10636 [Fulvimarina pelagi HTCC2506]|uniref:Uncharacterized protein n=1 Tax=Fulvimarina pelagi HTCC2506 TaxID=314231 RepID=Q0G4W9_9HYPH|nr:hypothetical protein [Fulvimarina pelagi]EAU43295.1 hypothetical protein FP2506_10636 [Fulvimarina pelagi HTCC2506]